MRAHFMAIAIFGWAEFGCTGVGVCALNPMGSHGPEEIIVNGPVDLNVYSKGRNQQEIGVLGHGSTASPEALLAKVHWALSNGKDLSILSENLCGENQPSLRT